jgi:hypothetical protein
MGFLGPYTNVCELFIDSAVDLLYLEVNHQRSLVVWVITSDLTPRNRSND